ncbi:L,D-transpeptidase family protein [Herbivorax sp. ANBcel31]|uniref:L,D-transpeptidase family protein n=1 Tax=Herbivorax sp. ANBcel31 TaxID=3069754 RepID=UPI0027B7C353|nr:L,D-transpeptidase family protein [Herbivorax sp. ANBcel31]MDQ2086995.1 L,D-transpeptidase family protein [Herbivorax sp. ANBcel31]
MKTVLKNSFICFLIISQLFVLNVEAHGLKKSDTNYMDIFKSIDEVKVSSWEFTKILYNYGLVKGLGKNHISMIISTDKILEAANANKNYNLYVSSIYEEQIDTIQDELITNTYNEEERILSLVNTSKVNAEVIEDANYYQYRGNILLGTFPKGKVVEILKDFSTEWYKVKSEDKTGWVRGNFLDIPKDSEINTHEMTKEEIEFFVNHSEFSSNSYYLVWVDIERQLTHVFLGSEGNWNLKKTMLCSTGKNESPTVRGLYKIQERGTWFYSHRLGGGAKHWVRFHGEYLFHSITMDMNQNIIDDTLGKRASAGCIRLSLEDSEWFYSYVPQGTTVYIN